MIFKNCDIYSISKFLSINEKVVHQVSMFHFLNVKHAWSERVQIV